LRRTCRQRDNKVQPKPAATSWQIVSRLAARKSSIGSSRRYTKGGQRLTAQTVPIGQQQHGPHMQIVSVTALNGQWIAAGDKQTKRLVNSGISSTSPRHPTANASKAASI